MVVGRGWAIEPRAVRRRVVEEGWIDERTDGRVYSTEGHAGYRQEECERGM